jgi:hypothetical protein
VNLFDLRLKGSGALLISASLAVAPLTLAAENPCAGLYGFIRAIATLPVLEQLQTRPFARRANENFSLGLFDDARARFAKLDEDSLLKTLARSDEEALALFETQMLKLNAKPSVSPILTVLKGQDESRKRALFRAMAPILKAHERPPTQEDYAYAIGRIYELNGSPTSVLNMAKAGGLTVTGGDTTALQAARDQAIYRRFELAVAARGVINAATETGLIRDSTTLSKFNYFAKTRGNLALAAAINAPFIYMTYIPIYMPGNVARPDLKLSQALIDKALAEGIDSIKPQIKELYGNAANFDQIYSLIRGTYNTSMLAVMPYFIFDLVESEMDKADQQARNQAAFNQSMNELGNKRIRTVDMYQEMLEDPNNTPEDIAFLEQKRAKALLNELKRAREGEFNPYALAPAELSIFEQQMQSEALKARRANQNKKTK